MVRRFIPLILAGVLSFPAFAHAAESVAVRTGEHDGYSRIVFEWAEPVTFFATKPDDKAIDITFSKAGTLDKAQASFAAPSPVSDLSVVSQSADEPLHVRLSVPSGATFRQMTVGNKVIVDVMGGSADKKPPKKIKEQIPPPQGGGGIKEGGETSPKPQEETHKEPETTPPEPQTEAVKTALGESDHIMVSDTPPPNEALPESAPAFDIALSSTESLNVAAFVRSGKLWIVIDRPDLAIPPQITGAAAQSLPPLEKIPLTGGMAWTLKLPDNTETRFCSGGGGLLWHIRATDANCPNKPTNPIRSFDETHPLRGGTALWAFTDAKTILDVPDDATGEIIKVIPVGSGAFNTGEHRDFVDFTALPAAAGLAIVPKVDDLDVKIMQGKGVSITRPNGGLALARDQDLNRRAIRDGAQQDGGEHGSIANDVNRIFPFDRWAMGGEDVLNDNQNIILAGMGDKDKDGRVADILTLAKMNLGNDRGQEAVGFLDYAVQEMPALEGSSEFRALRGAAEAIAGKHELALADFKAPDLDKFPEIGFWRAYTLAWLEDWQQAIEVMPKDTAMLTGYPRPLLEKLGIKLAEVALRAGDTAKADNILAALEREHEHLKPWTSAGLDYLQGVAWQQKKDPEKAREKWTPLVDGKDDFYRTRAGLALTMLEQQEKKEPLEKAIDRLEGLRYMWRGDELESQVNFMLGKLYIDRKQYIKGFNILRDAQSMSPDSDIGEDIDAFMHDKFKSLLMDDKTVEPLDAISIFEEFKDLTPSGADGNKLVQSLAERLVETDLLPRAAALLQHQVDYQLSGEEKATVAMRTAAINLLDNEPDAAIKALDSAREIYAALATDEGKKKLRESDMMRAKALSQMNRTEEAIALLTSFEPSPDVNTLRADIAWQAGMWEEAAEALNDRIVDESLDLARPLTPNQADLIMQRSVALNLSGNRVALTNMAKRYGDAMKKTPRAQLFEVVTRPRETMLSADKDTISAAVAAEPGLFEELWWGRQLIGLRVRIDATPPERVQALLVEAWRRKAPRRLAAQLKA
jgi:predicted negative regulator of RcsB-dependent stress response